MTEIISLEQNSVTKYNGIMIWNIKTDLTGQDDNQSGEWHKHFPPVTSSVSKQGL